MHIIHGLPSPLCLPNSYHSADPFCCCWTTLTSVHASENLFYRNAPVFLSIAIDEPIQYRIRWVRFCSCCSHWIFNFLLVSSNNCTVRLFVCNNLNGNPLFFGNLCSVPLKVSIGWKMKDYASRQLIVARSVFSIVCRGIRGHNA